MPKLTKEYNLKALFPEIAKQWHSTRNGVLQPDQFTPGSQKKVWWRCKKGCEWEATAGNRTKPNGSSGCPYCAGQKVGFGNDLETNYPEIAKQWHPSKNLSLMPNQVTPSSAKKVWWICSNSHSYETRVYHKTREKYGCPYCSNRKLGYGNDLANTYPRISREWHPTKNGKLKPDQVISGSAKNVWWQCKFGHEWKTQISHRVTSGTNCPKCSKRVSKPTLFIVSELKNFFKKIDFERKVNNLTVDIFIKEINLIIEYDGSYFHKNKFDLDKAKRKKLIDKGFSLINIRVKPLKKLFFNDITIEAKNNKSFLLISKILKRILLDGIVQDKKKITKINKYLLNQRVTNEEYFYELISSLPGPAPGQSLLEKSPHLESEWHPTKNGKMSMKDYSHGTTMKAWWICKFGHEWKANIGARVRGNKCPYCANQKLGYGNDLKSRYPKIAKLWHPTKNGKISASDVMPGSNIKKFWWKCDDGHEWEERIDSFIVKKVCSQCKNPNFKRRFYAFINNKKVGEWTSKAQCARDLKLKNRAMISTCLNGKAKTYKGYTFVYDNLK